MTRLLILSNSHPAISKGGSELAAWRMFEEFSALPGWDTWLLGAVFSVGRTDPRPGRNAYRQAIRRAAAAVNDTATQTVRRAG